VARVQVRYVCTEVAAGIQKTGDGSQRTVHTITLMPDPEATDFANGTVLRLGLLEPAAFQIGEPVTLTIEG
jgi:hypothetical protein